jgi:hypothetical protein
MWRAASLACRVVGDYAVVLDLPPEIDKAATEELRKDRY